MTASDKSRELARVAALAADDKQAANIAAVDVSDVLAISDVFVIASGDNERQVRAIVDNVEDALSDAGVEPLRREGNRDHRWVLLDYGGLVVHVQREAEREFYGLDRLYHDCPLIEVDGLNAPERPGRFSDEVGSREAETVEDLPLAQPGPDADEL